MEVSILSIKNEKVEECIFNSIPDFDYSSLSSVESFLNEDDTYTSHQLSKGDGEYILLVLNPRKVSSQIQKSINESVHEVKNVLTIVISSVLILCKLKNKSKLTERSELVDSSLKDIEMAVQNIVTLLNKLKDIHAAHGTEHKVKLKDFVFFTSSELETMANSSDINLELNVDVKSEKLSIVTLGVVLNQVVVNLAKNAIHSLNTMEDQDKRLKVEIKEIDDMIHFSIEDNGPGIKPEKLDLIFEEGYSSKGKDGSGVGLYICRKGILASGGNIFVDKNMERGAKFTFNLPLV